MKILAIDYGQRNIGLAISDEIGIIAKPLPALRALEKILIPIAEESPKLIILGLPAKGSIRKQIVSFGEKITSSSGLEVTYWNEDFTSIEAEVGTSKKFKKNKSHSEAARKILQEYLDNQGNRV